MNRALAAVLLALPCVSCAGSSDATPAAPPAPMASPSPAGVTGAACGAQVVIAFYTDGRCDPATDKESRTDQCLKEPAGVLYSRIVSGTDTCPIAPEGFECPLSAAGAGTMGVTGCTP